MYLHANELLTAWFYDSSHEAYGERIFCILDVSVDYFLVNYSVILLSVSQSVSQSVILIILTLPDLTLLFYLMMAYT